MWKKLAVAALACSGAAVPAPAQDMLAVSWEGGIYAFDSTTGNATQLSIGLFGQNCLTRDRDGTLWSIAISTVAPGPQFWLSRIDAGTATATVVAPSTDLRALAVDSAGRLLGIQWAANTNFLVEIDRATGLWSTVGFVGNTSIQGMTYDDGHLWAWDIVRGLGTLDLATGAFTDVSAAAGGGPIQWLAVRADGRFVGTGSTGQFYEIDRTTGQATQIGVSPVVDLRGGEASGFAQPFGQGCAGGTGPIEMSVRGALRPGTVLTSTSVGHSVGTAVFSGLGCLVLGRSTTHHQGRTLPLDLDPLLGTSGCTLYVSIDNSLLGWRIGTNPGSLQFFVQVPPGLANTTFHLQHAAFDQVPGLMTWSNGVTVRIGS